MIKKPTENYLSLVEDHRPEIDRETSLFQKVLVISARAKDLQQIFSVNNTEVGSSGYKALREFNSKILKPKIMDKNSLIDSSDDDEDESES